jgi:hypothetical protein
MNRRRRKIVTALAPVALVSVGVLAWTVWKMFAVGIHASDTDTYGGTDEILWLWLFLSAAGTAVSVPPVLTILTRHVQSPERRRAKEARRRAPGTGRT